MDDKIFLFQGQTEDCQLLSCKDDETRHIISFGFKCQKMGEIWNPHGFEWIEEYGTLKTDFPFLSGFIPVFSQTAYNFLHKIIPQNIAEYLPIEINSEKYYAVNILKSYSNILNEKKSDIEFFSSGRIMEINNYVFLPQKEPLLPVFKIAQLMTNIFVTETIVNAVKESNLTGANFVPCEIKKKSFWQIF